jgi:hypothetical protein
MNLELPALSELASEHIASGHLVQLAADTLSIGRVVSAGFPIVCGEVCTQSHRENEDLRHGGWGS